MGWRVGLAMGALAVASLAAVPARAELFRCQMPDGTTVFTDNAAACPGARPHEPRRTIQTVPSSAPPAAGALSDRVEQRALAAEAEAAQEMVWREKKARKEAELEHLTERRDDLREYVAWCNRGGALVRHGDDGLEREVSCSDVRDEFESLEAQVETIRAYLADGIFEECRRAGCLPGWVR